MTHTEVDPRISAVKADQPCQRNEMTIGEVRRACELADEIERLEKNIPALRSTDIDTFVWVSWGNQGQYGVRLRVDEVAEFLNQQLEHRRRKLAELGVELPVRRPSDGGTKLVRGNARRDPHI